MPSVPSSFSLDPRWRFDELTGPEENTIKPIIHHLHDLKAQWASSRLAIPDEDFT